MRNVYGKKKTKPALLPDFFVNSPEPRRSPRLRKVLEETSSNIIQRLDTAPPTQLSPDTKPTRKPINLAECCPPVPSQDEPVKRKQQSHRKEKKKTETSEARDINLQTTDSLAEALRALEISESVPVPDKQKSDNITPLKSSPPSSPELTPSFRSTNEQPQRQKQPKHPVKLNAETQAYITPLLECKNVSKTVESFDGWVQQRLTGGLSFDKIGEGSYGQVFRATDVSSGATAIVKLMPLNAMRGRRWQSFTAVDAAATEVRLLARMQKVPGYVEFRGACVLRGAMPEHLVRLWERFRDAGRTVESRDPRVRGAYPASQLWLMLEMADAGSNLEPGRYITPEAVSGGFAKRGKYLTVPRIWDIFWQTVFAVAKAETYCQFEHRDLHLGNICVKDTGVVATRRKRNPKSVEDGRHHPFSTASTGVLVTIIDYTLSRADMGPSEGPVAFDFQADEVLLSGEGDLQYDMYRWMDEIIGDRGSKTYDPRTNVIWFFHLLAKLLDMMIPVSKALPTGNENNGDDKGVELLRRQTQLEILGEVKSLTDPKSIETWIANSAGDLLQHAFAQDWISTDGL